MDGLEAASRAEAIEELSVREQSSFYLFAENLNGNHKLRGGYYTPASIAEFLCSWGIRPGDNVLEPSAGNGAIVEAAARAAGPAGQVTAVELYADEAAKIPARGGPATNVVIGDFFSWFGHTRPDASFDVVVGNPPFIRYQDFEEAYRRAAFELLVEQGFKPTRLTNVWMPFVAVAARSLKEGGRLALVVPAELLQVGYAAALRQYLVEKFSELTIVTFRQLVFDGIQQETVLLLGVRGESPTAEIRFLELDDASQLANFRRRSKAPLAVDLDHAHDKWTRFYLSREEVSLLTAIEDSGRFPRLGSLAEVDVGIVTGRNEFFVLTESEAESLGLREWCVPLVSRSAHVPGVIVSSDQWSRTLQGGGKCLLLQLGDVERNELPLKARQYIDYGEKCGFHEKYKCRIRLPRWWKVPSIWTPDAFLLRQIHDGPRMIKNEAQATCTDTIHRVRLASGTDAAWLAASSVNSLTFAFAEVLGRSYGGGVLELEPREAERLPWPPARFAVDPTKVNATILTQGTTAALDLVDAQLMHAGILRTEELSVLRGVWLKLFDRRRRRKSRHSA